MEKEFVHRTNPDGTFDSVCLKCFVTVATTGQEAGLENAERDHVALRQSKRSQLPSLNWALVARK